MKLSVHFRSLNLLAIEYETYTIEFLKSSKWVTHTLIMNY